MTFSPQNEIAVSKDQKRSDAAKALVQDAGQSQDGLDRAQFRTDQSFIAQFVMWVFGVSVCASLAAVLVSPLVTPDWKTLAPLLLQVTPGSGQHRRAVGGARNR